MKTLIAFSLFIITGFAGEPRVVPLYMIGPGIVETELVKQIDQEHDRLVEDYRIDLQVVSMANQELMIFSPDGVSVSCWKDFGEPFSWEQYQEVLCKNPGAILVDCTGDHMIAGAYPEILQAGVSIVTPTEKDSPLTDATVGSGLPILSLVKTLRKRGDKVLKVEATFSGTLSYLFNTYNADQSFADLLRQAQKLGYMQPDPRDDLNGMDMARKLVVLIRNCGYPIDLSDIDIQHFLPDSCLQASTLETFYEQIDQIDLPFLSDENKLRFIASYADGKASISLQSIGPEHHFHSLSGTDHMISITTERYRGSIVLRGPGVGVPVTAARLFDNILSACKE